MIFNTVDEALKACESAGYEPRCDTSGLGEQRFYVWLPDSDTEVAACYWGERQFLGWANAHFTRLAAEQKRREAGWELLDAQEAPSGHAGWHAPCGTHEDAWRSLGRSMPEDRRELPKVFSESTMNPDFHMATTSNRKSGREIFRKFPADLATRFAFLLVGVIGFLLPRRSIFEILKKITDTASKELQNFEQEDLKDMLEFIASAKW